MEMEQFLIMLLALSTLSGAVTEAIKKILSDVENVKYNLIAIISSFIIGGSGTFVYYQLNSIKLDSNILLYIVLMAMATALVSMVGYDKIAQTIKQFKEK